MIKTSIFFLLINTFLNKIDFFKRIYSIFYFLLINYHQYTLNLIAR